MRTDLATFLVERNAKEIARAHRQFKQMAALPWRGMWVGTLTPMFQDYVVEISYAPACADERLSYPGWGIDVRVLEPQLAERSDPPTRIPHLYRYPSETERPQLCLFWPHDREWDIFKSISDFIIPWTSEWLANYEVWKLTGRWSSPEAPHDVRPGTTDAEVAKAAVANEPQRDEANPPTFRTSVDLMAETALVGFPYLLLNMGI